MIIRILQKASSCILRENRQRRVDGDVEVFANMVQLFSLVREGFPIAHCSEFVTGATVSVQCAFYDDMRAVDVWSICLGSSIGEGEGDYSFAKVGKGQLV